MRKSLVIALLWAVSANAQVPDVLKDKDLSAEGTCVYLKSEFQAFVQNIITPQNALELKHCLLFTKNKRLSPAVWLLLLDKQNEPKEVIEWTDPAKFERIWDREAI